MGKIKQQVESHVSKEFFSSSSTDLCPSPQIRGSRLGNAVLLHSPSAMFLREIPSACESLIVHRAFRSKQGFIADRVK